MQSGSSMQVLWLELWVVLEPWLQRVQSPSSILGLFGMKAYVVSVVPLKFTCIVAGVARFWHSAGTEPGGAQLAVRQASWADARVPQKSRIVIAIERELER